MAQKGFAKVISTHDGDILVQKDNGQHGDKISLIITCLTNSGFLVSSNPVFPSEEARQAHYNSLNKDFAKQFINNMDSKFPKIKNRQL